MTSSGRLPPGWASETLEKLADFNPRHPPDTNRDQRVTFVPMPAVSEVEGAIVLREERLLTDVWKGYTHFRDGDVLFAKITPCMENGKIAMARGLTNGLGTGTTEFHVLRPYSGVLPEFLWRYLRRKSFRADAERSMSGAVGQRRVPAEFLKQWRLPVPPIPEQRRIVAKVASLFEKSKRAREELNRIPRLVERYKQAILAAAFRGDLTAGWRAAHGDAVDRAEQLEIGQLLDDIRYGTAKKCSYQETDTAVLRIPNVAGGRISLDDLKYAHFEQSEKAKLALQIGDLLMIRSNGSLDLVGRPALVDKAASGFIFAGYLIRLRPNPSKIDSRYLLHAFFEPTTRSKIAALAKSTSGVNNINSKQISGIAIPVRSLREQREIVRRIEDAFAWIDKLAHEHGSAARLVDRLDQAILSKAFRGELVPQDPADEPASVLLDRIRAERAKAPKPKRRGRPAKSS